MRAKRQLAIPALPTSVPAATTVVPLYYRRTGETRYPWGLRSAGRPVTTDRFDAIAHTPLAPPWAPGFPGETVIMAGEANEMFGETMDYA